MKTFTIIAGVNGCGKSSLTGVLRTELDNLGIIIDANNVSENKAIERIESCLERDICFTQETSLSGKRTLHTVQRAMKKDILSVCTMLGWTPWTRACSALQTA